MLEINALISRLLDAGETDLYRQVGKATDRVLLERVLSHVKGNQVQASELLGISRTTLRAKLRSAGISPEKPIRSTHADDL